MASSEVIKSYPGKLVAPVITPELCSTQIMETTISVFGLSGIQHGIMKRSYNDLSSAWITDACWDIGSGEYLLNIGCKILLFLISVFLTHNKLVTEKS